MASYLPQMKKREGAAINYERFAQGNRNHITVNWNIIGVKLKAPEEGHRTLGFQISGDGKCTAHNKDMKEKAILCGESISSSGYPLFI
jgi:hypothetical protein